MSAFGLLFLPLILAYSSTLCWIWDSWMLPDSYYSHGPLLPLVAAFLIWHRRASWSAEPQVSDRRAWLLLAPGLLLHAAGAALTVDSISAFSLVFSVPGVVWLAIGAKRMRCLWPVMGLVPFAVPMPMFVTGRAAFELKEFALSRALEVANLFGAGVSRSGSSVVVAGVPGAMEVADPCSGLRSLVALTTLGYCVAFFVSRQQGRRRWLLVLAAVPIAVLANVMRIAGICLLARSHGVVTATHGGHDLLSAGAWLFALAALLVLDALLAWRRRR